MEYQEGVLKQTRLWLIAACVVVAMFTSCNATVMAREAVIEPIGA